MGLADAIIFSLVCIADGVVLYLLRQRRARRLEAERLTRNLRRGLARVAAAALA